MCFSVFSESLSSSDRCLLIKNRMCFPGLVFDASCGDHNTKTLSPWRHGRALLVADQKASRQVDGHEEIETDCVILISRDKISQFNPWVFVFPVVKIDLPYLSPRPALYLMQFCPFCFDFDFDTSNESEWSSLGVSFSVPLPYTLEVNACEGTYRILRYDLHEIPKCAVALIMYISPVRSPNGRKHTCSYEFPNIFFAALTMDFIQWLLRAQKTDNIDSENTTETPSRCSRSWPKARWIS